MSDFSVDPPPNLHAPAPRRSRHACAKNVLSAPHELPVVFDLVALLFHLVAPDHHLQVIHLHAAPAAPPPATAPAEGGEVRNNLEKRSVSGQSPSTMGFGWFWGGKTSEIDTSRLVVGGSIMFYLKTVWPISSTLLSAAIFKTGRAGTLDIRG